MVERIAVIVVLLALALWGAVRPHRPAFSPPLIPVREAEPWMVDALPGIGPKRQAAALIAVRAGCFDELPKPARVMAHAVFE